MKVNQDMNNKNFGWIFLLILVLLVVAAVFGGYLLYNHALSPDNNYSWSEDTELRDVSSSNTATTLYNRITSNEIYFSLFYKDILNNQDYLEYAFTRSNIDVPSLYGEKFTVLENRLDKVIKNSFLLENDMVYTDTAYTNYQYKCSYNQEESLYNCVTAPRDITNVVTLLSSLIKVEQEGDKFYVYDKAVFLKVDNGVATLYNNIAYSDGVVLCDNSLIQAQAVCTGFIDNNEDLSDYIFKQYKGNINTYKHIFEKKSGNYYYINSVIANEEGQ